MSKGHEAYIGRVCPRTGRPVESRRGHWWLTWVLPFIGLASAHLVPDPRDSKTLPSGVSVSAAGCPAGQHLRDLAHRPDRRDPAYRRAKHLFAQSRYTVACLFLVASVAAVWWSLSADSRGANAAFIPSDPANSPMGVGKGIHPGRVVWVTSPRPTNWNAPRAPGGTMPERRPAESWTRWSRKSLRTLTGESSDGAAWNALFKYFNHTRNLGDVGYQPGEMVVVQRST